MNNLVVIDVERYDATSESASVTLSSGLAEVVAFCFPCSCERGDAVPNVLHVLDATKLQTPFFDDWPEADRDAATRDLLNRTGPFAYSGCGKVVDSKAGLVLVRGFVFDFGEVPAGAEFVEFEITRLDLR